jgi:hypothetical protein
MTAGCRARLKKNDIPTRTTRVLASLIAQMLMRTARMTPATFHSVRVSNVMRTCGMCAVFDVSVLLSATV